MEANLQYLKIFFKYSKIIFTIAISITITTTVLVIFIPNKYKASAVIMPPVEDASDVFGGMSSLSGALGGLRSLTSGISGLGKFAGLPGVSTASDVFAAMLKSNTIKDYVIKDCELVKFYKFERLHAKKKAWALYKTNKKLTDNTKIDVSMEGLITISVITKDPQKSADIANSYIEALDNYIRYNSITKGRRTKEFIAQRLSEEKRTLEAYEDTLKEFQRKNKTFNITEEIKAVVTAIAEIESQIATEEVRRDVALSLSSSDNSEVKIINKRIDYLNDQLNKYTQGNTSLVSLKKAPEIGMRYAELYRNIKTREQVIIVLTQQYEQAKIEEARNLPTLQVLDKATPPVKKVSPKRSIVVLLAFSVGIVFGFIYAYIKDNLDSFKNLLREITV